MHAIVQKIVAQCPNAMVSVSEALGEVSVLIQRESIVPVCRLLRDDPTLDFDHITTICSVDFPGETPRFEVVYHLYSIGKNHRIRIKARVPEEDCTIDSVVGVWPGANFLEREVYDMMGIRFKGHPDLRRILMTEDYNEGFPLRKDFPVEGKGWRDTFEFV